MAEQYKISGYHITSDAQFLNERYGIAPELAGQLENLCREAQSRANTVLIGKLTQLILKYPNAPQLKNCLLTAYKTLGNYEKACEVNRWILAEHPDYLFGLINQAHAYITDGQFEKVPEILGQGLELKELFPDRDMFHLAEFTAFYKTVIRYSAAIKDLELAENRLDILKEVAPDHHDTEEAETFLFGLRLKTAAARMEKENKSRIIPVQAKTSPADKKSEPPQFNHKKIECLYHFGLDIPHEKLEEILALPRETLIEDLEKVLADAENRYDHFKKIRWREETHTFALHAVFLLKEIHAVASLPKIVALFEYDHDFIEFWFGDHVTVTLWQCYYGLGFDKPELLQQILIKPGIYTYFKSAVSDALHQIALHHPGRREEILSIYAKVLTFFTQARAEENVIDSDFIAFLICDAMDCDFHELLPLIKELFEKQYVSTGICGIFKKVEQAFRNPAIRDYRKKPFTIFELYENVISTWHGYKQGKKDITTDRNLSEHHGSPEQAVSRKINRNDPCPCGSGKKYKKCCLKQ
jgi:tetratricopeptide (TPR) repeat protein